MKIHPKSVAIKFINEITEIFSTFPTKMELGETPSAKILHQDTEIINCWMELIENPEGRFAFYFIVAEAHQNQC